MFAGLCAARVWPMITVDGKWAKSNLDLFSGRAILTALVRGVYTTNAVSAAAASAYAASADVAAASALVASAYAAAYASSSYASSSSAAAAASASAADVASIIGEGGISTVMTSPLWGDEVLKGVQARWGQLKQERGAVPEVWGFWLDWYDGLLEGRSPDWPLWHEIVLIPDDVWKAGPEAVALAIEAIKAKRAVALEPKDVRGQAEALVAHPVKTRLIGQSAAAMIEDAVTAFLTATEANDLPASLQALPAIAQSLRNISELSQSAEQIEALEAQIIALVGQTCVLSNDVAGLRAELAKKGSAWSGAKKTAVNTTVGILTAGFWGTVVAGIQYHTGIVGYGSALDWLSEFGSEAPKIADDLAEVVEA